MGCSVDDGTVVRSEDFKIWKHTVPLGPFKLPHASCGGQVVVLLTVAMQSPGLHRFHRTAHTRSLRQSGGSENDIVRSGCSVRWRCALQRPFLRIFLHMLALIL